MSITPAPVSTTAGEVSLLPPLDRQEAGALADELVSHTHVEAPDSSLDVQGRPKLHGCFILHQQGQNRDGFSGQPGGGSTSAKAVPLSVLLPILQAQALPLNEKVNCVCDSYLGHCGPEITPDSKTRLVIHISSPVPEAQR